MPEAPDLQVYAENLNKDFAGKKLREINVGNTGKLNIAPASLSEKLDGQTVKKVYREGKEIHFEFSKGEVLGIHLMLHGEFALPGKEYNENYKIIELLFDDSTALVVTDWQGAATPTFNPEKKWAPDALSDNIEHTLLSQLLSKKRTNIKTFLLDQKNLRGIGNAYADEILWEARLHPLSICNKIPDDKVKQLAKETRSVLKWAVDEIKKVAPNSISGEVRDFLKIHNSKKKFSPTGKPILTTEINKRITYYTEEQELFK